MPPFGAAVPFTAAPHPQALRPTFVAPVIAAEQCSAVPPPPSPPDGYAYSLLGLSVALLLLASACAAAALALFVRGAGGARKALRRLCLELRLCWRGKAEADVAGLVMERHLPMSAAH